MIFPDGIPVFGDKAFRDKKCPKETLEQVTFVRRIRDRYPATFGALIFHVKNEGKRTWEQVARDKAEGMTTGAVDIVIPGRQSFLCELKRRDHTLSRIHDEQVAYLNAGQAAGAFACIALGADAAMGAFDCWVAANG